MGGRVFLITGTSSGLGEEYVKKVLSAGDKVVAASRNSSKLSFPGTTADNYLAVDLDVTDKSSIDAAFEKSLAKFGRVDVVCNNAGYGLAGEFESLSEKQIRTLMEVNFFGLMNVTRKAMEVMRSQKPSGGLIQQVTSIGGQSSVPTFSIYCASKWAVEGFTEGVQGEVKPEWGIKFTLIEPGGFRTQFAGGSITFAENKNEAYDHINVEKATKERNGTQAGDPVKGAAAFYELAVMDNPPLRCALGSDAYAMLNKKIQDYGKNVMKYEKLSLSTDVDGFKPPA
ncbi:hypothetical protein LTR50_004897 [Elasticomyces elasticus]|nr:hypothetical protein LTR50_004897 [Elasticomyces elasticus]